MSNNHPVLVLSCGYKICLPLPYRFASSLVPSILDSDTLLSPSALRPPLPISVRGTFSSALAPSGPLATQRLTSSPPEADPSPGQARPPAAHVSAVPGPSLESSGGFHDRTASNQQGRVQADLSEMGSAPGVSSEVASVGDPAGSSQSAGEAGGEGSHQEEFVSPEDCDWGFSDGAGGQGRARGGAREASELLAKQQEEVRFLASRFLFRWTPDFQSPWGMWREDSS